MDKIKKKFFAFLFATAIVLNFIACDKQPTESMNVHSEVPSEWYLFPTWSPTGEWIAYEHYAIDSLFGIWLVGPDGSDAYFETKGILPDFSPDGKMLALVRNDQIFVHSLINEGMTKIASNGSFPRWSPDGKKIVYASNANNPSGTPSVWIMDADGKNKKELQAPQNIPWTMPDWFPDFRILHSRGTWRSASGNSDLFVMDSIAQNVIQLTQSGEANSIGKVSPDGKRIIWERWESNKGIAVWMMNADGSSKVWLTDGLEPDWSPDSRHVIFHKPWGDFVPGQRWDDDDPKVHGSLWIMNVDTGEQWQFLPAIQENQKLNSSRR